jgi:NADP-dependent 3-hydroxy acid dehydrogenase YdfG
MAMTVAVTGPTGGIGGAVVEALASAGYELLAIGRPSERLDELCARVKGAVAYPVDLGAEAPAVAALSDVAHLDGLVHCAGVSEVAAVADTSQALWQETLAANLTGPAAVTRALLPALRAARGRVVFINAAPGSHAIPQWSAYTASKAALRELADSLREEEDAHGVRVTTVYPGGIRTSLLRKVREQLGRPYDPATTISPETLAQLVVSILTFPDDAHLTEISLRAAPSGAR